jgi:hypothetical protein
MESLSMSDDKERLLIAQWVFERTLSWLAAAEVKVGVIVAIDTALLGSLGAAFSSAKVENLSNWAYMWTVGAGTAIATGIFYAAMAILPKLNGPEKSLVFFGRVGILNQAEYLESFKNASDKQLLEDWTSQIHRNAQIACEKFGWVRVSMYWSFVSIIPWLTAIVMLLKK